MIFCRKRDTLEWKRNKRLLHPWLLLAAADNDDDDDDDDDDDRVLVWRCYPCVSTTSPAMLPPSVSWRYRPRPLAVTWPPLSRQRAPALLIATVTSLSSQRCVRLTEAGSWSPVAAFVTQGTSRHLITLHAPVFLTEKIVIFDRIFCHFCDFIAVDKNCCCFLITCLPAQNKSNRPV